MKKIMGSLAYVIAGTVVVVLPFFGEVKWYTTAVALGMLVLGALYAWTDPKPAAPACDCPRCEQPEAPKATADDVR